MIDERDLAAMFDCRAKAISLTPIDAAKAIRQARSRLVRNVAALLGIVTVIWVFAGVRTIG